MAVESAAGTLGPILAIGVIGALGVGAQWLAWRLRLPAIVLMLGAGLLAGPAFGLLDPAADIGPLLGPVISLAVAVILFEGGLTLNFHHLRGAEQGVRRLVVIGAPLGWLTSALALHYVAGLGWESAAVFGGIMIVTGPTVIAPLLRSARLSKRPAALLQWEAIVNDPIGALAAVLAFEVVVVLRTATSSGQAAMELAVGIGVALVLGAAGGYGLARAFRRGAVPEYMKVPVLMALVLFVFAVSDSVLHESGLLAVTVMGVVIANAGLPSYAELHRFKEHVTILLVSGVFILLAASLDPATILGLDWRAAAFVAAVILVARPATVLIALLGAKVSWSERLLVAFTRPARGGAGGRGGAVWRAVGGAWRRRRGANRAAGICARRCHRGGAWVYSRARGPRAGADRGRPARRVDRRRVGLDPRAGRSAAQSRSAGADDRPQPFPAQPRTQGGDRHVHRRHPVGIRRAQDRAGQLCQRHRRVRQ